MSDHFAGQIWIGGKVDVSLLKGLIAALHKDDASHEYGDVAIEADCIDWDSLSEYLDDNKLLNLKCDQAENGEFPWTEGFCINHGITFDRWSDRCGEYDAEDVYWRSGMSNPMIRFAGANGREMVEGTVVREGLELVKKFADNYDTSDRAQDWQNLAEGLRLLKSACPELPAKLEPFEVVL